MGTGYQGAPCQRPASTSLYQPQYIKERTLKQCSIHCSIMGRDEFRNCLEESSFRIGTYSLPKRSRLQTVNDSIWLAIHAVSVDASSRKLYSPWIQSGSPEGCLFDLGLIALHPRLEEAQGISPKMEVLEYISLRHGVRNKTVVNEVVAWEG